MHIVYVGENASLQISLFLSVRSDGFYALQQREQQRASNYLCNILPFRMIVPPTFRAADIKRLKQTFWLIGELPDEFFVVRDGD